MILRWTTDRMILIIIALCTLTYAASFSAEQSTLAAHCHYCFDAHC